MSDSLVESLRDITCTHSFLYTAASSAFTPTLLTRSYPGTVSPLGRGGGRPPPPPPGSPYSLGGSNGWRTLKSIIHPDVGKLTASGESIHVLFTGVYSLNRAPGSENTDAGKKQHTPSIREIHLLRCCVPHLDDVSGLFDHGRLVSTQYTRARNRKEGGGVSRTVWLQRWNTSVFKFQPNFVWLQYKCYSSWCHASLTTEKMYIITLSSGTFPSLMLWNFPSFILRNCPVFIAQELSYRCCSWTILSLVLRIFLIFIAKEPFYPYCSRTFLFLLLRNFPLFIA